MEQFEALPIPQKVLMIFLALASIAGVFYFVLIGVRLFDDVYAHVFPALVVVTDVGDQQVGFAIQLKRGDILPIRELRIVDLDAPQLPAAIVDRVQPGFATVVDDPEQIFPTLGVCDAARLVDIPVFETAGEHGRAGEERPESRSAARVPDEPATAPEADPTPAAVVSASTGRLDVQL